jgi:diguanylate cyclase (GGDEF)-like protein/PAS domain S-box-containing protein
MPEQVGVSKQLDALLRAATNHVILTTDLAGTITMFNGGAERLLGYRADDIVGRHTPDIFFARGELTDAATELGVPERYCDVVAAAVGKSDWTRDWVWLTSAGVALVVRLSVTVVAAEDGSTESFLGIATDVTAEVQANAELRATEARWRTLLSVLPNTSVLVLDEQLRYQTAVGARLTSDGQSEDLVGKSVHEALAAEDAYELELLARAALNGTQQSKERRFSTGHTFSLVAMPLRDKEGNAEALIIAHDVTDDRLREHTGEVAQQRFRRLFNEAPNGTALLSLSGEFLEVNPALCSFLGRDADQLVGSSALAIAATATDAVEMQRFLTDLLDAADGRAGGDWTVSRADGQTIYLAASGVVLADEDGKPESVLTNLVDVSRRRKNEQRLAHLAHHDPLTGLANRRRFDQELTAHLDRCRRYGATGALMVLDLDHFKEVNDTMGHAAGDQLIVATADALRNRLRTSDVVARMGGDEFAILLPNVDRAAAEGVAASVVALIRDDVKVFHGSRGHSVTTSVGVVLIDKTDVTTAELLGAADLTMYQAKEAGRDRYAISGAGGQTPKPLSVVPSWADRIASALSEQRLVLHAQPLINVHTNQVEGAELLVRMIYGDNELVLPDRFLYVAERVGLMPAIDSFVITQATEWLRRLEPTAPDFQLHVNISAVSMGDDELLDNLQEQVLRAGIDPSRLVFELSEAAASARLEAARSFTERVSELGCQLALDNFGAGFGSFYYLEHLHFDAVKVTGELVSKSMTHKTDRLILQSVLDLARGLGKRTIAEAVEDAAMLEAVTSRGIDFAQGYFISRPQPVENVLAPLLGH